MAKRKSDFFKEFRNINEFVSYLDTFGPPTAKDESNWTYDPEWHGSVDYADARQRVLTGDGELAKKLRGSENLDIRVPSTGTRRKMQAAVVGFMPHVPNAIAGIPTSMITVREQKISKKVISVYYGVNTSGSVSAENITKVSARVMSCIMSLERKGYRVNLYAVNCANTSDCSSYKYVCFTVKIKDSGQHMDVLKMAMPMISPAWNRRMAFRLRELNGVGHGMGRSVYGDKLREFLDEHHVKYDVALSYYDAENVKTVEGLEKLFIESTKKINK